jgi:hypothetical protein
MLKPSTSSLAGTNARPWCYLGPESTVSYQKFYQRAKLNSRWVVSNKFWTSSGITAGIDMAAAFVRYLVEQHIGEERAKEVSDAILGATEVT